MPLSAMGLALLICAIWGLNFAVIKWGGHTYPAFALTFYRYFFTVFPFVFFVKKPKVKFKDLLSYNLVLGVLYFTLLFIAMRMNISASLTSILVQTQAIFTLFFSLVYLKDKPETRHWLGVAISFVGVILISRDLNHWENLFPALLVLLSAVFLGFSNVLIKKIHPPSMVAFLIWGSIVPLLPLYAFSLAIDRVEPISYFFLKSTPKGLVTVGYMAFFSTLIAFSLWGGLVTKYSPKKVAPFALMVPFFGVAFSAWMMGESLSLRQTLGGLILLLGLGYSQGFFQRLKLKKRF